MKCIFSLFLFMAMFINSYSQSTKTVYTCPMHPQVGKSAPGNCPICGMTLVKKTITEKKPAAKPAAAPKKVTAVKKTTAKKPEITAAKTKTVTEVKKTVLPKAKPTPKDPAAVKTPQHQTSDHNQHEAAQKSYTCPMHPEVVSDKPGQCPKCGMNLVLQEKKEDHSAHGSTQMDGDHKMVMPMPEKHLKGGR